MAAAGFTIPPLESRSSATSDIPATSASQLREGDDHARLLVVAPVRLVRGALEVAEVAVGACGLKAIARLGAFFSGALDSLRRFLDSGLPDADLVFTSAVPDEVRTYSPIVVLEGGL